MLHFFRSKVLAICFLVFLTSCSGGSNVDTPECGPNSSCLPVFENSVIDGGWELACYLDTDLPAELGDIYRKVVVTFSGDSTGSYSSVFSGHRSAVCAEPAIADESGTLTGTYSTGIEFTSDEGLLVTELDLMKTELTPLGGESISPILDRPLSLTLAYIENNILYFGIFDDELDQDPPARITGVDFDRPFLRK